MLISLYAIHYEPTQNYRLLMLFIFNCTRPLTGSLQARLNQSIDVRVIRTIL